MYPPVADPTRKATTKSEYLAWRDCPEEAWLDRHEPATGNPPTAMDRLAFENGQVVDALAQEYLKAPGVARELFGEPGEVRLQEVFHVPTRWEVRADAVFYPASGAAATVVEVKASTAKHDAKSGALKPEKKHLYDLAYQRFVMRATKVPTERCGLLLLSGDYCLDEGAGLDLACLFTYADVTRAVDLDVPRGHARPIGEEVADEALEVTPFLQGPEPSPWDYTACANKAGCRWMQRALEDLPSYSVFDVPNLRGEKLASLLDQRVLDVRDVPAHAELTDKQRRQVAVAQREVRHCDQAAVDAMLAGLPYPHYFLDYETVQVSVPDVPGMSPYERLVFQYSLHVRCGPGEDCAHYEHLLRDRSAGSVPLLEQLRRDLPDDGAGTVLVWNKGFECSCNDHMAATWPAFADYLAGVNARVFDLMDVFKGDAVEDPAFRGSASIKRVLPALVPELTYAHLPISEGGTASYAWHRLSRGEVDEWERDEVRADLLRYCALDTLAMVELFDWALRDTSDTHPVVRF